MAAGTPFANKISVMNNKVKRIRKTGAAAERGSIMMEYVIVLCGIGIALCAFMTEGFYDVQRGFGPFGQMIVAFYQRTLGGLSLPVP